MHGLILAGADLISVQRHPRSISKCLSIQSARRDCVGSAIHVAGEHSACVITADQTGVGFNLHLRVGIAGVPAREAAFLRLPVNADGSDSRQRGFKEFPASRRRPVATTSSSMDFRLPKPESVLRA